MSATTKKNTTWSAADLKALEKQREAIQIKRAKENPDTSVVSAHLFIYNLISTILWIHVLALTIKSISSHYPPVQSATGSFFTKLLAVQPGVVGKVWDSMKGTYGEPDFLGVKDLGWWVKWTQTLALLEIVHSALGFVKSPVGTVAAQVASRVWTVWGVVEANKSTHNSPLFTIMILAWSITEIIRYAFYLLSICGASLKPLTYLRYSTFLLLYPIGASSEAFLSFSTLPSLSKLPYWPEWLNISPWGIIKKIPTGWEAKAMKSALGRGILWRLTQGGLKGRGVVQGEWGVVEGVKLVLFVGWWPALYVLFSHMVKQRKRVLSKGRRLGGKVKTT